MPLAYRKRGKMETFKSNISAEIDFMIDEIVSKFGHEAEESILFCKEVESNVHISFLRAYYIHLMAK